MSGWCLSAAKVIFPVGRAGPEYHRHEGEEWLYVLSGRVRLTLGEEATVAGVYVAGDAGNAVQNALFAAASGANAAFSVNRSLVADEVAAAVGAAA